MTSSLPVELNRDSLHDVAVVGSFSATDSFVVDLTNHGEAVHVHLHIDDDLSRAAALSTGNHYVERGETVTVPIDVRPVDSPVSGMLKVVTGYGARNEYVSVTVEPAVEEKPKVQVDETLSKPKRPEPDPTVEERLRPMLPDRSVLPNRSILPVLAFIGIAIVVAIGVATRVESPAVMLGAGVVIGGALAALFLLVR